MTYLQIINLIKDTALAQPNVNSVVREFLDLNREDAKYSAVVIQDRDGSRDRIVEQDYVTYTWHLGYVDRLTFDESNRDDIISTGINIINNIVNTIRNNWFPELEVSIVDRINTFDQRFTAQCAGVYVVLAVNAQVSDCVDSESTDLYDTYDAKITANGVYHFVPSGRPVDEINITVDVAGAGKEEVSLTDTVTMNGTHSYIPEEDTVYKDVELTVDVHPTERLVETYTTNGVKTITGEFNGGTVNVDVHPSDKLVETITNNGSYSYPGEYTGAEITVSVSAEKPEESLVKTISSNGNYHYDPSAGSVFSNADITVDVHPSDTLSETYTTNGIKTIIGEFNGGSVNVDVHPSDKLVKTITNNGTTDLSGEWKDASITVAVPSDQKPETICEKVIQENGSYNYVPEEGSVFNRADITVDVHPSNKLVETITSNGTTSFSGEWKDADITVSIPEEKPEESLEKTITSNGSYHYDPSAGSVFSGADITVNCPVPKTEERGSLTISSNGSGTLMPSSGNVFDSVDYVVDVHPSDKLVETITSNGTKDFSGEWKDASITVDVHPSSSLSKTYTENGTYNVSGEWKDAAITVAIPVKTETSLTKSIRSNGSYHYEPEEGSVFNMADVTVDVHPSVSLSKTYTSNGNYNISGEFNGGTVTVAVSAAKPEESLVETISSNGSYHYAPTPGSVFSSADITVAIQTTTTVTMTQAQYDALTVKDPNTIYLING